MIRSFANKETERLFSMGTNRRLPPDLQFRALAQINRLDSASTLEDLASPPSNRLESLKGDRAGQWSIRINQKWRLCFRFEGGNAFEVEVVDYH